MNATTFDSLSAARRLKGAGIEENQVEAIAEITHEAIVANREKLLTKTDLAAFEVRVEAELASAFNRMTFIMLIAMGVLFAALKSFRPACEGSEWRALERKLRSGPLEH